MGVTRVNMAEWLPFSYNFNQIAILVLGFWAIINQESAVQVELVCVLVRRLPHAVGLPFS